MSYIKFALIWGCSAINSVIAFITLLLLADHSNFAKVGFMILFASAFAFTSVLYYRLGKEAGKRTTDVSIC